MSKMTIQVAFDYTCPYCYIGHHQVLRLREEFGVEFDYLCYELWPEGMEIVHGPVKPDIPGKPRVPTRFEFALAASGVPKPRHFVDGDRIHNALEATEHAKAVGVAGQFVDRLFRALWIEGLAINDLNVLSSLAEGIVPDVDALLADVENRAFADKIVLFDDPAHATGVYNVPTFVINGKKFAEQPFSVLERAIRAVLN